MAVYAQEGKGILLSFNRPCTILVNCLYATPLKNLYEKLISRLHNYMLMVNMSSAKHKSKLTVPFL